MNPQTDKLIEEALRSYPLADVPLNFSRRVMSQVRATPHSVRFRLTWMDYALGFFLTLLMAVGFTIWSFLPHQVLLSLQLQWQLFQWTSVQPIVAASLAVAGLLLFLAFLFSLNLLFRSKLVGR
jgi:hypothetical protein